MNGCGRKMSQTCAIFTTDGLDAAGYPTSASVAATALLKSASPALASAPAFAVSIDRIVLSPIRMAASDPAGAFSCVYVTEARDRVLLAISQLLVKFVSPVGLNWNEQSAGSATTTTLTASCALESAGLATSAMNWKIGK